MQLNDQEKIVLNKSYQPPYNYTHCKVWQARSQKFAMGEGLFWGPGGGAPWRRRLSGVWGQSPQPSEARGPGGGAQCLKILNFFSKCALGNSIFFKTWKKRPAERLKILNFFSKITLILGL